MYQIDATFRAPGRLPVRAFTTTELEAQRIQLTLERGGAIVSILQVSVEAIRSNLYNKVLEALKAGNQDLALDYTHEIKKWS